MKLIFFIQLLNLTTLVFAQHSEKTKPIIQHSLQFKNPQNKKNLKYTKQEQNIWKLSQKNSLVTIYVIGTTHIPSNIDDVSKIRNLIDKYPPNYYLGEVDFFISYPSDPKQPIAGTLLKSEMMRLNIAALDCLGINKLFINNLTPFITRENFTITQPIYSCILNHELRLSNQVSSHFLNYFYEIQYYKKNKIDMESIDVDSFIEQNLSYSSYEHLNLRTFGDEFIKAAIAIFKNAEKDNKRKTLKKNFNTQDEAIADYLKSKKALALTGLDNDQPIEELYTRIFNQQKLIVSEIKKIESTAFQNTNKKIAIQPKNSPYRQDTNQLLYSIYSNFLNNKNNKQDETEMQYMETRNLRWAKRILGLFEEYNHSQDHTPINIYLLGGNHHFQGNKNVLKMLNGKVYIKKLGRKSSGI